jgi:hypothetical protein
MGLKTPRICHLLAILRLFVIPTLILCVWFYADGNGCNIENLADAINRLGDDGGRSTQLTLLQLK